MHKIICISQSGTNNMTRSERNLLKKRGPRLPGPPKELELSGQVKFRRPEGDTGVDTCEGDTLASWRWTLHQGHEGHGGEKCRDT